MERQQIIDCLTPILRDVFRKKDLVLTDSLCANDVDTWDSVTHVMMIDRVEKEFGIKFRFKELGRLKNLGDLIDTINCKL